MPIDLQWGVTEDLIAYMGESWEFDIRVFDRMGAPVDLSAVLDIRCQIKAHQDQTVPDLEVYTAHGITIKGMEDKPAPFAIEIVLNATIADFEDVVGTLDDPTAEIVDQDNDSPIAMSTKNIIGIKTQMTIQTVMNYFYDIRVELDATRFFYPMKGTIQINQNVTR